MTRLAYLHVPKTAGTSFVRVLRRQFGASQILHQNALERPFEEKIAPLEPAQREAIRCVYGHFPYGIHTAFVGPTRYVTILREPVQRVVSAYGFDFEGRGKATSTLAERGVTLASYLDELEARGRLDLQTRLIAGGDWRDSDDPLARAKANIERDFVVVGLTERFEETLLLCGRRFGWWNLLARRDNVTPRPASVSAAELRLVAERNPRDVALYAWARERFETALREARIGALEVAALELANRAYHQLGRLKSRLANTRLRALVSGGSA